jgi:hypothetical protein
MVGRRMIIAHFGVALIVGRQNGLHEQPFPHRCGNITINPFNPVSHGYYWVTLGAPPIYPGTPGRKCCKLGFLLYAKATT